MVDVVGKIISQLQYGKIAIWKDLHIETIACMVSGNLVHEAKN